MPLLLSLWLLLLTVCLLLALWLRLLRPGRPPRFLRRIEGELPLRGRWLRYLAAAVVAAVLIPGALLLMIAAAAAQSRTWPSP
jgi:hypothetical protein